MLELGLGNGRTYDHLRALFPDRDIYVCERKIAAHPDCVPPPEYLILGDMVETLPALRERFGGRVALVHFDAGTGDKAGNLALAAALTLSIMALLCRSGVLVSDPAIGTANLNRCRCQNGISAGRYHLYRRH